MKAADVVDVPVEFQRRVEGLMEIAERDGREEALRAIRVLLQKERERLPDGPAWREIVYLQETIEGTDFRAAIPRGRRQ